MYTTVRYGSNTELDPGAGVLIENSEGNSDIFIIKTDDSGELVWARLMNSSSSGESTYGIAVSESGFIMLTGSLQSTIDFDLSSGVFELTAVGQSDVFIQKLAQNSVGIENANISQDISVFPNPSNGLFRVYRKTLVKHFVSNYWHPPKRGENNTLFGGVIVN